MKMNVGIVDRIIRTLAGIGLIAAWALSWVSGTLAIVLGVVGIVLIATAGLKFCPLYRIFGARTCAVPSLQIK